MRFLIMLFFLLVPLGASLAHATSDAPTYYTVRKGDTEVSVAKKYKLTVAQLRSLNRTLKARRDHHLIRHELLNVNLSTAPEFLGHYRWTFPGGDPAGEDLVPVYLRGDTNEVFLRIRARAKVQADSLAEGELKELLLSMLEWQEPKFRLIQRPLTLDRLVFGGSKKGSKMRAWKGTIECPWKDLQGRDIEALPAMVYDPILYNGNLYQFLWFLGCQNGALKIIPIPAEEAEMVEEPVPVVPETIRVETPCPPETVEVIVAPPVPVEPEASSRYYLSDCVWWLTNEYVQIDPNGKPHDERTQDNLFLGHEHTLWPGMKKNWGFRLRNSEALFDLKARSGDHNLGLVMVPVSNRHLRLDLEGGLGYTAQERLFWEVTTKGGETRWDERKLTTDGMWGYGRTQWINPTFYADLRYRSGKPLTELGGFATMRAGPLYAKAGLSTQFRHAANRHVDQQTIRFAADSMYMKEARLGIIFSKRFLMYGSWNDWRYRSDLYRFTRFGPGGGFEWNLSGDTWRLDGDVIRFSNFDDALWEETLDGVNGFHHHRSRGREWRMKLGLVYAPATKTHRR